VISCVKIRVKVLEIGDSVTRWCGFMCSSRRWQRSAAMETRTRVTWLDHVHLETASMTFHALVVVNASRGRCSQLRHLMCCHRGPPRNTSRRLRSSPHRGVRHSSWLIVEVCCRSCLAVKPTVVWRPRQQRRLPAFAGVVNATINRASTWRYRGQLLPLQLPASVYQPWFPTTTRQQWTVYLVPCPTASWTGRRGLEWQNRL